MVPLRHAPRKVDAAAERHPLGARDARGHGPFGEGDSGLVLGEQEAQQILNVALVDVALVEICPPRVERLVELDGESVFFRRPGQLLLPFSFSLRL